METVLEELCTLCKHHVTHQRELFKRNKHEDEQINKNNQKFEIGQHVMVKNHVHHTFEAKYLLDYRVQKCLRMAPYG